MDFSFQVSCLLKRRKATGVNGVYLVSNGVAKIPANFGQKVTGHGHLIPRSLRLIERFSAKSDSKTGRAFVLQKEIGSSTIFFPEPG